MHWVTQYLSKPWRSGGTGPDVYDCWGLTARVQQMQYNRECPLFDIVNPADPNLVAHAIERAWQSNKWRWLKAPVDGCIVAMSFATRFHHVGTFLGEDGGHVLHTQRSGGCSCQTLSHLRTLGWHRIEFYQHITWPL